MDRRTRLPLVRIVSGGQTGVDRGALDAAMAAGLDHGGWCPPGRTADDGVIPERYELREAPADRSPEAPGVPRSLRSDLNVRDSDATLVFLQRGSPVDPGTQFAMHRTAQRGKPVLMCDPYDDECTERVRAWLARLQIRTLNVAGPSDAAAPGIGDAVRCLLERVLS
jgi:hypothetical protein